MGCCRSKPAFRRSHARHAGQRALDSFGDEGLTLLASIEDEGVTAKVKKVVVKAANAAKVAAELAMGSLGSKSKARFRADEQDVAQFLYDIDSKLPFTENRWDCIWKPERAVYTLGPYANLSLEIQRGRNVLTDLNISDAHDLMQDFEDLEGKIGLRHMFVRIFVDDRQVLDTGAVHRSDAPEWNAIHNIDIVAARSMIRLQIFEGQPNLFDEHDEIDPQITGTAPTPMRSLGFVEFCVGDIPFRKDVECWLELRFPDLLQGNNVVRYDQHRKESDENRNRRLHESGKTLQIVDLLGSSRVHYQKKKRARSRALHTMKGALHLDSAGNNSGNGVQDDLQFNAGELRVKMVLVPSTSASYDKYFALALNPPFAEFELLVQQDHLPALNLQSLVDDTLDVKLALFDDFIMSFLLYMWYILLWKSRTISFFCTLTAICWLTEYPDENWARLATFVTCLIVLFVNLFENQRLSMTTGGPNAPLTEEGFKRVANWDDPWQMHVFILRVVALLGGTVRSEHDLHQFVVPMVKDGVPVVSLRAALEALRRQPWCKLEPQKLKAGDLVRLHGRRKATVKKIKERVCRGTVQVPTSPIDESVSARDNVAAAEQDSCSDVESGSPISPTSSGISRPVSRAASGTSGRSRTATKETTTKVSAVLLEFEPGDEGLDPENCTRRVPLEGELVYSTTDRSTDGWKMTRVDQTPDDTGGEQNILWTSRVFDVDDEGGFRLSNDKHSPISETLRRSDFWFLAEGRRMWATTDDVEARLLVPPLSRTMVSTVDQFGVGLKTLITAWSFRINAIKETLFPVLQHVRDILTWKKYKWTAGIVMYFVLRIVLGIIHMCHKKCWERPYLTNFENIIRITLDNAGSAIFVIMMCRFAVHFGWLRSVVRISDHFWRKRFAPKGWAFAKEE